jgi:hypothetical protein
MTCIHHTSQCLPFYTVHCLFLGNHLQTHQCNTFNKCLFTSFMVATTLLILLIVILGCQPHTWSCPASCSSAQATSSFWAIVIAFMRWFKYVEPFNIWCSEVCHFLRICCHSATTAKHESPHKFMSDGIAMFEVIQSTIMLGETLGHQEWLCNPWMSHQQ